MWEHGNREGDNHAHGNSFYSLWLFQVLELGVLDVLLQYLSLHQDEANSTIHILTVLSCVADSGDEGFFIPSIIICSTASPDGLFFWSVSEEGKGLLTRMDLLQPLSQLLAASESAEVLELSLELLNSILDSG